jgi:hypothetical protein
MATTPPVPPLGLAGAQDGGDDGDAGLRFHPGERPKQNPLSPAGVLG